MQTSSNAIRTNIAILVVLFAGITLGAPLQEGRDPRERVVVPEDYLPEGEARNLIFQGCVQCHDLRNTVSQRKSLAGWRRTVNEMIWRGAPLMADEADVITKYLAAGFGREKPIPDIFKKKSGTKKQ